MSWSATISGHIVEDVKKVEALEKDLADRLQKLVSELFASHGITNAHMTTSSAGPLNLMIEPGKAAPEAAQDTESEAAAKTAKSASGASDKPS